MNSLAQPKSWSMRRIVWSVAAVFFAQIFFILFLNVRHNGSTEPQISILFRLFPIPLSQAQISTSLLVNDPTLFVLASQDGFSGPAWLSFSSATYEMPEWNEPPRWLAFNPTRLKSFYENSNSFSENFLADHSLPEVATSILPLEKIVRASSEFRVEGALQKRKLISSVELRVWPRDEILSSSRVQIGANAAGEIVAARLLERTGVSAVDVEALQLARRLQFQPVAGKNSSEVTWGELIFEWQTVPVGATNALPLKVSPE